MPQARFFYLLLSLFLTDLAADGTLDIYEEFYSYWRKETIDSLS